MPYRSKYGDVKSCGINETINSEDCVLGSKFDSTVGAFEISDNKEVKYLPRKISEKFPNLKELFVERCGIIAVRDYYFKNMKILHILSLGSNEISSLQPNAFKDLVSLKTLHLHKNMITTLDERLFTSMVALEWLFLRDNKIKYLNPATFKIPGGNLYRIYLEHNICINEKYDLNDLKSWDKLEADIKTKCAQPISVHNF